MFGSSAAAVVVAAEAASTTTGIGGCRRKIVQCFVLDHDHAPSIFHAHNFSLGKAAVVDTDCNFGRTMTSD